jgi:hypothetical protein
MILTKKKTKVLAKEKTNNTAENQVPPKENEKILSHKKIPSEKEIEKSLKSIYQEPSGKMPNLSKLELKNKHKTRNLVILIIIILTCILIVSFLGLLIFQPTPKFTSNKVGLEIKAPFSVKSGEKFRYEIKFTNQEETSLTKTQLIVYFPNGFIFDTSTLPSVAKENDLNTGLNSNIKTWKINDFFSGQSKTIEINGRLIGDINSKQTISATLSYVPANFSSEFQKNASFTTEVNDSLLNLEIEHAAQIADQEETEIILKVTNKSADQELYDLEADLNYPPEFILQESQIIDENNQKGNVIEPIKDQTSPLSWTFEMLPPQAQKQIKIKGKFDVTESKQLELSAQLKLKGPAEDYFLQKEEKFNMEIIKGELLTNLIISGSNQNKPVNFGETLNYLIVLQNKSKSTLGDLKVRAVLDSTLLDWTSLTDKSKGIIEESQIFWTKDQIPTLALLLPEEEVEINFQINLKNYQPKYKPEDLLVKSYYETQINQIDNNPAEIVAQSNTIINELNTNLDLQAKVLYFDNNQTVGFGPLPPIVGQKTTYQVYLNLTNSLHDIQDIDVKIKLPSNVNLESGENISTGDFYRNEANEISWRIARIPNTINDATANFGISITPNGNDAQKILTLISEINLTAVDIQTKGQIIKLLQGYTTNLDDDPLAKGKGLVQTE